MSPRRLLKFVFLVFIIKVIRSQWNYDEGLKEGCRQMGGTFKPREKPDFLAVEDYQQITMRSIDNVIRHAETASITGDTCDLKFKTATRDDDDSREFCELYAPWRLIRVERTEEAGRHFTICHVEATLTCKSKWMQMFGYCFQMPDKPNVFTYEEGVDRCKKEGGEIAYMHQRYIPGVWRRYFRGVGQIWVQASESFEQYVQKTKTVDGSALALAFFGLNYHFSVYPMSLIRIDPNIRLQLLCQYKPPINAAEVNYLGRRYSEIYYPAIPVEHGVLIRSASSYTRSTSNLEVCQGALQPFLIDKVQTFIPTENVLEEMKDFHTELMYLTRSGAVHSTARIDHSTTTCSEIDALLQVDTETSSANYFLKDFTGKSTCDNMLSASFRHTGNNNGELSMMSDSRSLPVWCKLGYPIQLDYKKPTDGWIDYVRPNGEVVAHKLFTNRVFQAKAQEECAKVGGVLSGFTGMEEADLLRKLGEQATAGSTPPIYGYWIGAIRRRNCQGKTHPFDPDESSVCSLKNLFIWEKNAAMSQVQPEFWIPEKIGPNPTSFQGKSFCVAFIVGNPAWAVPNVPGFLDDVICDYNVRGYFCQKDLDKYKID